jgi:hypothetical protein
MKTLAAAVLAGLALTMPADAAGPSTVTGKINLKLTITIVSSIGGSIPVQCGLSASVTGSGSGSGGQFDDISETDTVTATRSGSTAVCQLAIPYQWILYGTGDTVSLYYTVGAQDAASNGRSSSVSFETIPVPKNGATTSYALTARI